MQDIPREQIIKRFQTLPESLQNEIFSEKSADAIIKHCALRDVPDNKVPIVGRLSTRVLLGYLRPELFALEIQKETGMDMQKAQLVAHDLDMEIFSAVRLELKKLYPPTIQTPTVQSWKAESHSNLQPTTYNLQPKPKYVIPIPEKFLRQSADAAKSNTAKPADQLQPKPDVESPGLQQRESPVAPDQTQRQTAQQPTELSGRRPGLEEKKTGESRQSPIPPPAPTLKANEAKEANETPSFKPIVPLPTFIQARFNTTRVDSQKPESRKDDAVSAPLADDPRIKNLISKFTSSETQKPKPPGENPYREKV